MNKDFAKKFADNLKSARIANKYTQDQLAQKIGKTTQCICNYEKAIRLPNLETVAIMSTILDVSLDDLIPCDYVLCTSSSNENQTTIFDLIGEQDG